ncbi:MAG: helix-turn-helix transcriptional regulator [Clostridia bacterium]|nr:helix-turn-helix transcriptional regulator [Clostridia bacterium]
MNNKKMGEFISTLRKELNLSQKDLAQQLNITDKAVSKWETGRSAPDVSMLIPLADVLGISVTEILKGERICNDESRIALNEIIVLTLKKSKLKVMIAISLLLVVFIGLICSYPAYHYFSTISENDFEKVRAQAVSFFENEEIDCIAITQNSDKIAYLFADDENSYMLLYERNKLFKNRIENIGASGGPLKSEFGLGLYCFGTNGETIIVMFGAKLDADRYSFSYQGTEHIRKIKDGYVLDVFIDKDYSFTNPTIMSVGDNVIFESEFNKQEDAVD